MKFFSFLLSFALVCKTWASPYYIALKQRNIDKIINRLAQVSDPDNCNYGNYMTHDQIRELVSPTLQDVIPLMDHLQKFDCTWYGDMIKCKNNPGDISNFSIVEFVEHAPLLGKKFNKVANPPTR